MNLVVEHITLAAAACAGALAAQGKKIDLFGVLVLALVTSFGGGTLRDLCLDAQVVWLRDRGHIYTVIGVSIATFILAQRYRFPIKLLDYVDAISLALYAIHGTQKAVQMNVSPVAAVTLGTMTGVAGGILRDVLLNEVPSVFRASTKLYATAAIIGCAFYIALRQCSLPESVASTLGVATVLTMRLAAIHWTLYLPEFQEPK